MSLPATFSPQARRAIAEAAIWIADDNPAAARRLRIAFEQAARLIGARPQAGRLRSDLVGEQYRLWSLSGFPYLLIYQPDTCPPRIVRVLHTARDLPAALADLRA